jgi:hypothetical protein
VKPVLTARLGLDPTVRFPRKMLADYRSAPRTIEALVARADEFEPMDRSELAPNRAAALHKQGHDSPAAAGDRDHDTTDGFCASI